MLALRGRGLRHVVPRRRVSLVLRGRRRRLERGVLGGDPEEEEGDGDDTRRRRRRRRKSWAHSRPQHREAGTLGVVEEAAAAIRSLCFGSGRDRRGLNPEGPCAPLAIRVPRAAEEAAAAARADGTRAPEERRLQAAMTFPSSRPPRREEHEGGGAPWSPGGAQDTSDSAPSPNRNWPLRLSQSDRSVKGRGRNGGMRQ